MPGRWGRGGYGWQKRFRGCIQRMTVPRQAIMDTLQETSQHLSAEDVFLKVHKTYPAIGLTTIYRNLELLVQHGIVTRHDFGDGRARYELSARLHSDAHHHHHLVCKQCGKVVNYDDFVDEELELVKKTEKRLARKHNFDITDHVIQFYGMCPRCQEKGKV